MESFFASPSVTSTLDDELKLIFRLQTHEVSDVSVSNEPRREAYFELQQARTFALNNQNTEEGLVPITNHALRDAALLLAFVVSSVSEVPAISPLVGGGIGVQWNGHHNTIFTASFFGDSLVTFSAILSDLEKFTGTCEIRSPRSCFIELLRDVLEER